MRLLAFDVFYYFFFFYSFCFLFFFFQAEDGIRYLVRSRGLGDVYKRQVLDHPVPGFLGLLSNYHGGNIVSKAAAEAAGADFGKAPVLSLIPLLRCRRAL